MRRMASERILGGGMDLPIKKWLAFRLFEADYVWTEHNYSDFVAPLPDAVCGIPNFNGVRLRTGLVFSWGGRRRSRHGAVVRSSRRK